MPKEESKIDAAYLVGAPAEAPTEQTPSVEESEETSQEETDEEEPEEGEESEEDEKGKGESDQEEPEEESEEDDDTEEEPEEEPEHRPTRSERRIQKLTRKLHETSPQGQEEPDDEETPQNPGSVLPWQQGQDLSPEQLQAAISEGVRSELEAREVAAQERAKAQEWLDDYQEAVKVHPELDPKSKSYNQKLDDLLTALLSNPDGTPRYEMKVTAALAQVKESLAVAEKKGAHKASVKLAEQAEESALTPGGADDEPETYTEEDLKSLRINNPRKYNQLVKEGKI